MKKAILAIGLAVVAGITITAQQFQVLTNTYIPPVTWTGTNAAVITKQLLNLTNAYGQLLVPASLYGKTNCTLIINIHTATNGVSTITARIQ